MPAVVIDDRGRLFGESLTEIGPLLVIPSVQITHCHATDTTMNAAAVNQDAFAIDVGGLV